MVSSIQKTSELTPQAIASEQTDWPSSILNKHHKTEILKEDDLFLITDPLGNINGFDHCLEGKSSQGSITGLFGRDSRFLSRSELQIEGKAPIPLGIHTNNGYAMEITATNPFVEGKFNSDKIAISRHLALRGALLEEITFENFDNQTLSFQVSLSFAADFRDLFEVRQYANREEWGHTRFSTTSAGVQCEYDGLCNSRMVSQIEITHLPPTQIIHQTLVWNLSLASHEKAVIGYRLVPQLDQTPISHVKPALNLDEAIAVSYGEQDKWNKQTTHIRTNHLSLNQIIEQAEQDIYLLLQSFNNHKVLAAGIPWYSTLFGRDAIIAAQQTLMLDPVIAKNTLITLANHQGQAISAWHDEEPGKVMHELRLGEMARCHEIPHTPYYGTIDATPLWVLLYLDYFEWTGDEDTINRLWPNALSAMNWIEKARDERGYLCYERQSERGLDNQGWKDSDDCIVNGEGNIAEGAIALCEVQGYMYSAYQRMSQFAEQRGENSKAIEWKKQAEQLKNQFNQDFWMEDLEFIALALTDDNQHVDSITSNPGHCLSLGILDNDKLEKVATRLMGQDLFNGWGIRTLSNQSKAYNPMSYHNGSIWPHDNALIAVGMRHVGHLDSCFQITQSVFDMTRSQTDHRPPELFCGFDRQGYQPPIAYPVACSPQAWATGSIFQLLQLMLNPIPNAKEKRLTINRPSLPDELETLTIHNLKIGKEWLDIKLHRQEGFVHCDILQQSSDLEVMVRL